ncbi:transcription factor MYB1R1-like [Impatiens glandulifera]|uniref:transcription factor MYB1R1-like n=1 Tax=Impatiens glandulifera TaxID=253017 RepID=UPI001FB12387|nr:transcription factor MYB1R1-like [Impatiens glandulifera]
MSPHGTDGNHSRASDSSDGHAAAVAGGAEIVLFGVRVKVDPMRKCVSLNDLSQYELPQQVPPPISAAVGYTSADDAIQHRTPGNSERKRGIPWTEDEHKLFLLGLQKVGKGDWRGISRNFVKTRTPTQVASHAQKYFLRRSNLSKRRRRSSLFDITAESVAAISMEEENTNEFLQSPKEAPVPVPVVIGSQMLSIPVSVPVQIENSIPTLALEQIDHVKNESSRVHHHVLPTPFTSRTSDLNSMTTNHHHHHPLSLDLSLSSSQNHLPRYCNLNNGESIISVA